MTSATVANSITQMRDNGAEGFLQTLMLCSDFLPDQRSWF
jgi:hypothetical protein